MLHFRASPLRVHGGRLRRLGAAVGLVVFGVTTAVVLIELILRIWPGLMPPHALNRARLYRDLASVQTRPDPYIGFLYPPDFETSMRHYDASFTFRTDARGFRNATPWPGHADIVALGDSVTFGFGVPDGQSWVDIVARAQGNPIVNLALPGFGPVQQLRVYERFGTALRPDLVLVGFFPANDFWDTDRFLTWLDRGEGGNYLLWRDFGVNGRGDVGPITRLVSSSYVHSFLWAVLHPGTTEYGRGTIAHRTDQGWLRLQPKALRKLRQRTSAGRPEFEEAMGALQELDRRVRADGGRMVIVVLPSKEYVYMPLRRAMKRDPLGHVYQALDERRLTYLDVTPLLRERAAAGERLFFEFDGHPNRRGYEVIAEAVVGYLRSALPRARHAVVR
jgi:hypothetical protein